MIRTMRHLINLLMRRIRAYLYTPKARKGWNIFYTGELTEWVKKLSGTIFRERKRDSNLLE